MIHGYITKEGRLCLSSSNPTEQYALTVWRDEYDNGRTTLAVNVEPAAQPAELGCDYERP